MKKISKGLPAILLIVACCVAMALVDGVWQPGYLVKSAVKILILAALPTVLLLKGRIGELTRASGAGIKTALLFAVPTYLVIVGGYFLLRESFDFSGVVGSLAGDEGVTRDTFPYVALYISFVNSFVEELFFRGVAYLYLGKICGEKFAFCFSAAAFSLYHVAIMQGWFSPLLFLLLVAGLFLAGAFFNLLDRKSGSLLPSYLVHMGANFAINTVGFILFGII